MLFGGLLVAVLALRLLRVYYDSTKVESFSENGRQRANDVINWSTNTASTFGIFTQVLGSLLGQGECIGFYHIDIL